MVNLWLLFSSSVVSDPFQPYGLQHAGLPCPSPSPGACSNSCPLSRWYHPTISSSVISFSCLQSFPESGSFEKNHFFISGGQSIGVSASPSSEYSGLISFRMDWLDLLAVQGTLKNLLQHYSSKASILWCSAFFILQLLHPYMTTGKTIGFTRWTYIDYKWLKYPQANKDTPVRNNTMGLRYCHPKPSREEGRPLFV